MRSAVFFFGLAPQRVGLGKQAAGVERDDVDIDVRLRERWVIT